MLINKITLFSLDLKKLDFVSFLNEVCRNKRPWNQFSKMKLGISVNMYLFPFNWHVLFDFHVFLQKHQKNRNTCPHSSYEGYSFNNCINELHILCPVRFDTKLEVIQNTLLAQGLFKEKKLSKSFLHKYMRCCTGYLKNQSDVKLFSI